MLYGVCPVSAINVCFDYVITFRNHGARALGWAAALFAHPCAPLLSPLEGAMLAEYLSAPRRKGTRPCTTVRTRTGADLWSCGDDCRWSPSSAAATLILRASRAGAAIADGVAEERTANAGSLVSCDAAIAAHTVRVATNAAQHVATPRRVATIAVDTASAAASFGVADPPQ